MEAKIMRAYRYPVVICGPAAGKKWEIRAPMDTGATCTRIPRPIPEGLRRRPVSKARGFCRARLMSPLPPSS